MAKVALLIGVSQYEAGLPLLPGSVLDVEALQPVLAHPEMGGFAAADMTTLKNPTRQAMEDAIYHLFENRQREDLLLFYFSGHGIKDEQGKLYLATHNTRKDNGRLVTPSAVAATFLHEMINRSRSQRQVIILDCCFSGAIAQGMTVKDDGSLNVNDYLGGKGRAILTSSSSLEYSLGSDGTAGSDPTLSVYTRYLVQGIETGAADADNDGWIEMEELHDYVARQVKAAAPTMTPRFYPVEEGYKIRLAKAPKDDPRLKYRKELESRAEQRQGKFSVFALRILENQRKEWGISVEEAEAIRVEVLRPYREYEQKLQDYEQALREAIALEYPFSPLTESDLQEYRQHLGLKPQDREAIESRVLPSQSAPVTSAAVEVIEAPRVPSPQSRPFVVKPFSFDVVQVNEQGEDAFRTLQHTEVFTEDLGHGIALNLVPIPGGRFWMGQTEAEKQELIRQVGEERYQEIYTWELPRHQVTVPSFWMGQYPITQAQYEQIMGKNPSYFKGAQRPVEWVSWWEAMEFCQKLSERTNHPYRLPSEAEWEYACRAGTETPFYFGETLTTDLANYDGNYIYGQGKKGTYRQETTEVGQFPPNAFGLYDLHGNVWEWCADHWHENYNGAPTNGSAWLTEDETAERMIRGGSWIVDPRYCRSAVRVRYAPGDQNRRLGFRVVCGLA